MKIPMIYLRDKILFNGYYGYANTGDDSFIEAAVWGAKNIWNEKNIFIHTNEITHLPILVNNARFYNKKRIKGQYRVEKYWATRTSKSFVTAGGSMFYRSFEKNSIRSIALQRKRNDTRTTIGAIGVSLGPFKNTSAEKSVQDYLKQIDFLTLRDRRSYEIAKSFGLPYEPVKAFDLAALLPVIYKYPFNKKNKSNKKIIGISLCNYENYPSRSVKDESRRNNTMNALFALLAKERNIILRFFIFNGNKFHGDENIILQAITKLRQTQYTNFEVVPYYAKTMDTWYKIAECDFVIATRLHAAIFACFANVPFMLNEYQRKCSDFLADIGQNTKYMIGDAEFEPDIILQIIRDAVFENKIIPPLYTDRMIKLAALNFETTKHFFNV